MTETLQQRLLRHEGIRLAPYRDTVGKLTIGVGRCLDTEGITEEEAMYLLANDIASVKKAVGLALPWVLGLDEPRQEALYEMAFQLGINGLLGFVHTLAAIKAHDWETASKGMLNSQWHYQTPERCEELADIILNG